MIYAAQKYFKDKEIREKHRKRGADK